MPWACPRDRVERVAICGNPIQLSLFQGMEIRDLAYAGESKRASLGVEVQSREARIITVGDIAGFDLPRGAELVVPPAVRHEIGADALAMMIKSGMLDRDEIALVTDYGTNAEMALKVGDTDRHRLGRLRAGLRGAGHQARHAGGSGRHLGPGPGVDGSYRNRRARRHTCWRSGRRSGESSHRAGDRGRRRAGARHHRHGGDGGYRPGALRTAC